MLSIRDLHVQAGKFSLKSVSLEIPRGQCGVLMGKTGCGKTTLLEAVCGLKQVRAGTIVINDRDVTNLHPGQRGIGFVPQDTALFAAMTVWHQLAFGPRIQRWTRQQISERVSELAENLGIVELLDRKPVGLSGGEAKRVALGRALAPRPRVLCLDEPLAGLDEETQSEILEVLQQTIGQYHITTLHITHSRTEAKAIGDRIFRMDDGRVSRASENGEGERGTLVP